MDRGARMIEFGGWMMPVQYEGIVAEHRYTRSSASVFDTCHMGEFMLSGCDAAGALERVTTVPAGSLAVGRCRYGYLLNDDGGVLDDLTCYRLSEDRFMLVVNAGTRETDADWIQKHLTGRVTFEDSSEQWAKLDVQGPKAFEWMGEALAVDLPDLRYFRFAPWVWKGREGLLSRTGYTGERGVEWYLPSDLAVDAWRALLAPGRIRPAGLGARDTLRLEMGYPLYGQDLGPGRSPVAASRDAFLKPDGPYIGADRVTRDLREGCDRYLCGLVLEGRRAARHGDVVMDGPREIGLVTGGSWAPSLECPVALAYLDADHAETGTPVEVPSRRGALSAVVADLPFYRDGTARAT